MASIGASVQPPAAQDRTVRPRSFAVRNGRLLFVWGLLIAIIAAYVLVVPQFRPREQRTLVNSGLTLATASLGQTLVVLTGGIDLSIGPMVSLTNSIASATTNKDAPNSSMVVAAAAALGAGALGGLDQRGAGGVRAVAADYRHPGDGIDLDRDRPLYPAVAGGIHPARFQQPARRHGLPGSRFRFPSGCPARCTRCPRRRSSSSGW